MTTITGRDLNGTLDTITIEIVAPRDPEDACDVLTTSLTYGLVERLGCESKAGAKAYARERVQDFRREFRENA